MVGSLDTAQVEKSSSEQSGACLLIRPAEQLTCVSINFVSDLFFFALHVYKEIKDIILPSLFK